MKKILLSRTDNLGDVVLTLPMAGVIKQYLPEAKVYFLGKYYTADIIKSSQHVDHFLNWSKLKDYNDWNLIQFFKEIKLDYFIHVLPHLRLAKIARKAHIPHRIGTYHRIYNLLTCNRKILLSRKKSILHESQLNLKLLEPLKIQSSFAIDRISDYYGLTKLKKHPNLVDKYLSKDKFNLILHPKSFGSAIEWPQDHFAQLIKILPSDNYNIIISGTRSEGELVDSKILSPFKTKIIDTTGKLTLEEFIYMIFMADGLIAASTGPLHIASALELNTLGLYSSAKSICPRRWMPIGKRASYLVTEYDEECLRSISPKQVMNHILSWQKLNRYSEMPQK
mgnify:CR=1 FL=1|tara:strand:- start:272 stop:1282 length:1011 start_codon:yes stop_codon:yes gene_type:complete